MDRVVKVVGNRGEKVIISGSYKCTEHSDSWFSFNKDETFRLCPRCRNEHKSENAWFSIMNNSSKNNVGRAGFSSFLSSLFSHF